MHFVEKKKFKDYIEHALRVMSVLFWASQTSHRVIDLKRKMPTLILMSKS